MRSNISIGGQRQLRVAVAEQLAAPAGEKLLVFVARRTFCHASPPLPLRGASSRTVTVPNTGRLAQETPEPRDHGRPPPALLVSLAAFPYK